MKNTISKLKNKILRIDKRILLIFGIIVIVSPGWMLGLYWLKYQKLPWEGDGGKKSEDFQSQDNQVGEKIPQPEENTIPKEERSEYMVKNDVFQEFPYDLTSGALEAEIIKKGDFSEYSYHETYLVINSKRYNFTNHTHMYAYGSNTIIDIQEGLKNLENSDPIYSIIFSKKGSYVFSITFDK